MAVEFEAGSAWPEPAAKGVNTMRSKRVAIGSLILCVLACPDRLFAVETPGSVAQKATAASRKHVSVEAKLLLQVELGNPSQPVTNIGQGTYEQLNVGDVIKFRMDLKNKVVTETNNKTIEIGQSSISVVSNGQSVFTLTEKMGEKTAVKNLSRPNQSFAASQFFFDSLFRENFVQLLPDEKVDGKEVWVIESRPKMGGQPAKTIHYILKDCGLRVKTTGHDPSGARIQHSLLTEIKLDQPPKPARFVFKAPPGVSVVDLSESK
jgi:outer membrane lipoprotein-sorting protein